MVNLKNNLKNNIAFSFLEELKKENNYIFISNNTNNSSDLIDSFYEENNTKKSIISYYKINENDIALGIKRINWEQGTIYEEYNDRINNENFYVVNYVQNNYRVYKCLNNNNNATSLISPTTNNILEQQLSDGYVWKFMYQIPEFFEKFITDDYIPIPVLEENSYVDERSLQLNVENNAKEGPINEINIKTSENNTNLFSKNDIINTNFELDEMTVLGTEYDNSTQNYKVTVYLNSNTSVFNLSSDNDYYNNNYIILFNTIQEGILLATITDYSVNLNTKIATITFSSISGSFSSITSNTKYSILPKIKVNGDGNGEILAYPVFTDNILNNIEVIETGSNYTKAEAKFLLTSPYILEPIISPNDGHGKNAINELNCKTVLVNKKIDKHKQSVSSENKYFFGNSSFFSQYGIIKNLKTKNNDIIKNNFPINEITLLKSDSFLELIIDDFYIDYFSVNDIITIGSAYKKNQFRAKILEITNQGSNIKLYCQLLNGLIDQSSSTIVLRNETTNSNFSIENYSVTYTNLPEESIFENADIILGNESLFTCSIENIIETDSSHIKYNIKNLEKTPLRSFYTNTGDIILGESVSLIKSTTDLNEFLDYNYLNVLDYTINNNDTNSVYSKVIKISINSTNSETGEPNLYLSGTDYKNEYIITKDLLNFGKILYISYSNPVFGGYQNAIAYIIPEKGSFEEFSSDSDRELFICSPNPYSIPNNLTTINGYFIENSVQYESFSDNLDINSGEVTYLENIDTVFLNDDNQAEINIALEI
jgi:hypothetical protein